MVQRRTDYSRGTLISSLSLPLTTPHSPLPLCRGRRLKGEYMSDGQELTSVALMTYDGE